MKKRPFSNKNVPILCHCEERSDVAILKSEVWHPVAKHGSAKREEIPIIKTWDLLHRFASSFFILRFCFVPSYQGSVSFRATIFRYGMTNRFVKDCRVGRTRPPRNDTKLVGFMKKPTSFLIRMF